MQYQITLPNGEVVYVDESVPPKVAAETIKQQRRELFKTNLLSAEGLKSLFTTPGDLIDASAANTMAGLYRMKEGLLQYGQDRYPDPRRQQALEEARQTGHEYAAAGRALEQKVEMQTPNPSWPLQAAQSIIPSMAQSPASLFSLGLVPTAQAYNSAKSQGVDDKNAAAYASIAGPSELLSEIPLAKAFKELGKEPVKQVILKLLARDIGSENLNVIAEHLAEQAFVTPDRPLKQALEEYVHKAAVATMAAGGQTAVVGTAAKTGEVMDKWIAGETPEITNRNPRNVPPSPPTQPPPPPPAPKFTDIEAELAPLMSEIRDLEAKVDEGLKLPEKPITATPVEPTKPPVMQALDARQGYDTGMSAEVLRNPDNFEDPNTILNRSDRLITRAIGIDGLVGLRWGETDLEKIKLTPGPVVLQVGEDSNVRPGHYMQGLLQDLYNLALEFNPQGKYVVLPEDLATKEQKAKAPQGGHFYQNGIHYIIPRWQTNQNELGSHTSKEGKGKYNPLTKLDAYSTLGHEFGHSLIEDFFFQGLAPEERTLLRDSIEAGQADPALASKLAPTAQKILADWAELRAATLENRISAKEAAARWLSPSKLQKKVIQKELGFGARNFTAKQFADKVGIEYQLSFDEYLAEQVAKAMFTQERMEKSELLKATFAGNVDAGGILSGMEARLAEFFGPLLDTLKQLYNRLTAMGLAGPADSTLTWLEGLGENARLAGERKVEGKKAKQAAPVERPVDEPAKPGQYYATLRGLRLAGLVKRNSKHHRQLTGMLKRGDFEGFLREIEPLLGTKLRQDITEVKSADIRGIQPAWIVGTGSPNKWTKHAEFGKLNIKKVGTGEGTIWEGFGVYMAESPASYQYYRDGLAVRDQREIEYKGKRLSGEEFRNYMIDKILAIPELKGVLKAQRGLNGDLDEKFAAFTIYRAIGERVKRSFNELSLAEQKELVAAAAREAAETFNADVPLVGVYKAAKLFSQAKLVEGDRAVREFEITAPPETFLLGNWDVTQQSDFVKQAIKKLPEKYRAILMPENAQASHEQPDMLKAYWRLAEHIARERNIPYTGRHDTEDIKAARIVSRMLNSVGISGMMYLNHSGRKKHSAVPPEINSGNYNIVLYRDDLARPLYKSPRGKPSLHAKHNENISRRLWREKKTDSPNFQSWFAGSKAVTHSGNPLKLHFNTSLTFKDLEGEEFYVGSENYMRMLEIADLATGGNAHPKHTRIIPGWLAIKNIKQLPPPEYGLSPTWLSQEAMQARKEGYDGLVIYGDRRNNDLWIGLARDTATYDPDYKHTGNEAVEFESKLRFDTVTEEGETTASKWKLLRSKLNLPYLADGITALSNLQYWGLQTQQLGWMNPSWNWLANFSSDLQKFYRKIGQMHSRADAVVRQLQWFGKENLALIYKFTKAEYKGGEHWTELRRVGDTGYWEHVPTEKTLQKLKEFGIDVDTAKGQKFLRLYIEAKNALQYQMDEMQRVLYGLAARKYSSPTRMAERNQKFQEIAVTFKLYRSVPFWPQHSFGKYRVQVWSSDDIGKLLVYENASDSITEAEEILQQAKKKYPGKIVQFRKVTPNQTLIQRLPAEFLDDLEVILELNRDDPGDMQKLQEIRDAMQSLYTKVPEQTYNPLRRIVEGGSTDFIKIYADFALRNANFIAKMEHKALLQQSIAQAEQEANEQETMRGKAKILRAVEFMQGTLNYSMDPHEEMAQLRGVIAITYLWANVKTALLNFWGLVHTLGVLNRELGYVKGAGTFGKSVLSAARTQGHEWGSFLANVVKGSAETALVSITDPNWEMVDGKPTELRLALEQAKQENVLDQSYAYYLATQAMRGQLIRMASASLPGKLFKGSVDAGMSLFRGTELLIRRSTFIATYKALQQSQPELTPKERYEKATRMTLLLQGDYTKGNRPQLMRGNLLSFITIFMTFVQTASWNAYGGMEIGLRRQEAMEGRASPAFYRSYTMQLILLYLFVAGLEGLPGMENALDILDALFKKWNNGKSARQGIYEVLNDLDQDPLKWTRGVTFNLGGFDVSRSIGLGRLVPGTDTLASEHGKTKEFLGDFVGTASGIGGGYVQWVVDLMSAVGKAGELDLDMAKTAKDQVARLPGGIGNIFKAAQWAQVDARGPSGALLAFDEKTQMAREIEWWEITGKALGFQPASISRAQHIKGAQYDSRMFWSARRKLLLDNLMQAQEIAKDREATADARRAIEVFNSKVPAAGLRITQDTIKKSLERRKAAIKAAEQYMPTQKSLESLYREQVELLGGSME